MELGVYVVGWFVTARFAYWMGEKDGPLNGEDRLACGFLALFWPIGVILAAAVAVILLPTLRWRRIQRAGYTIGWAFARRHLS